MNVKQIKAKMKKNMGYRWYFMQLHLLFDFDHQYDMWLLKRHIYHLKKVDYYAQLMDNLYKD